MPHALGQGPLKRGPLTKVQLHSCTSDHTPPPSHPPTVASPRRADILIWCANAIHAPPPACTSHLHEAHGLVWLRVPARRGMSSMQRHALEDASKRAPGTSARRSAILPLPEDVVA